ncbi:Dak1 domain-containing protein [Polychytrium aggregatum]|uniref:Dak1 domain-containing protein n=1 Tax=Polychytrium aggregatum TaxID=110093 RepID=UPI0022FE2A83|nr:Dak1 domain-containing protein [Polychytrium aggregatum]KAI9203040.1 Dak1 domain-containing protein [Polychytrium aggregatum]
MSSPSARVTRSASQGSQCQLLFFNPIQSAQPVQPVQPVQHTAHARPMSSGKKLINLPAKVVDESLAGLVAGNPGLVLDAENRVVRLKKKRNQVALISGGGSGHEPAHAGFVGDGVLSAAVCGDVFASPSAKQVLAAIEGSNNGSGALLIVKNYTGDRLQFGKAGERAKQRGIDVELVVVADDCAIPRSMLGAGRRGLSGTLFVHKIAGAAAYTGLSLKEVGSVARAVSANVGTVGVALTPCSIPGKSPTFSILPDNMELGLGIHGESGLQSVPLASAKEVARACLDMVLSQDSNRQYLHVPEQGQVALLVNNLGGTTNLELGILVNEALQYLASKSIRVARVYSGAMMTSLEMCGVSFSILNIPPEHVKTWMEYLDLPVSCSGWPRIVCDEHGRFDLQNPVLASHLAVHAAKGVPTKPFDPVQSIEGVLFAKAVAAACHVLIEAEPKLTSYDQIAGDGDCGLSFRKGAEAILAQLHHSQEPPQVSSSIPFDRPGDALAQLSYVIEDQMGGSSGALLCIFLDTASNWFLNSASDNDSSRLLWPRAVKEGVDAIRLYGGASVGDRTLVDALVPLSQSLLDTVAHASIRESLDEAEAATVRGADSTAAMGARKGRSSYINTERLKGTPDPGAEAIKLMVQAIVRSLKDNLDD